MDFYIKEMVYQLGELVFYENGNEKSQDIELLSEKLLENFKKINVEIDLNEEKMIDLQNENQKMYSEINSILYGIVTKIIPSLKSMLTNDESFVKNIKLHIDYFCTKIEYLELKMEMTIQDLIKETYDEENTNALNNIKMQLERKLYVAKNKYTHYQRSLETYNNLGEDFKNICDKYTLLLKQYDDKKWALDTL